MDFKKIKTETTVVTRQKDQFYRGTGNIYETVAILSIRANQIASEMKAELNEKIESFSSSTNDSLEEVFENKEQIEIAKFYERLPKPTLIAIYEFLNDTEGAFWIEYGQKEKHHCIIALVLFCSESHNDVKKTSFLPNKSGSHNKNTDICILI